jgi:hypothetical protein
LKCGGNIRRYAVPALKCGGDIRRYATSRFSFDAAVPALKCRPKFNRRYAAKKSFLVACNTDRANASSALPFALLIDHCPRFNRCPRFNGGPRFNRSNERFLDACLGFASTRSVD